MTQFKIEGVNPVFDGDYEIDLSWFTNRELREIKLKAGVRAGEIQEALDAGDNDLILMLAVIAANRNGKQVPFDALLDSRLGSITVIADEAAEDEEDEDRPPASATTSGAS